MAQKRKVEIMDEELLVQTKKIDHRGKYGSVCINSQRKQRRPWRNKVRRKAAKELKRKLREEKAVQSAADKNIVPSNIEQPIYEKKITVQEGSRINESTTMQEMNGVRKLDSSLFRFINEQLYNMTGSEAAKLFQSDPHAFEVYHRGYLLQSKRWSFNPIHGIIQWIKTLARGGLVVADMGCGDAKIAQALSNVATVHSFDLIATNEYVTECDMSKVPLESESVDVVIFCLSLMGTNLSEYIWEGNRILKKGGFMKIVEVASRFESVRQFTYALMKAGFELANKKVKGSGYFVILEFIKTAKMKRKKLLGLKLKPCLYKKR